MVVHGFCSSKDEPAVELIALRQSALGRRVLTFDLRGHGESGGRDDARAGTRASTSTPRWRPPGSSATGCVVVGSSMGGVATIEHLAGPDGLQPVGAPARPLDGGAADGAVIVATPARWQVPRSTRGVLAVAIDPDPRRAGRRRPPHGHACGGPPRPGPRAGRAGGDDHAARWRCCTAWPTASSAPAPPRPSTTRSAAPRLLDLVPGMGHGFCPAAAEPIDDAVGWVVEEATAARPHAQGSAPG